MARNSVGMNLCYRCGISPHLYYINNSDVWAVSCKNPKCDEYEKPVVHTKAIIAEQEWNKKQEFMKTKETIEKVYSMIEEFKASQLNDGIVVYGESDEIQTNILEIHHDDGDCTKIDKVLNYYVDGRYLCVNRVHTENHYGISHIKKLHMYPDKKG